jgi:hypothetical protein
MRMAAIRQTAVQEKRPIARRVHGRAPIENLAWQRRPSRPCSPAVFAADRDQVVLGQALAARAAEATRLTAEAAVAAGLPELVSGRFAKPIHDLHKLATRAIARFLVTGQGTTETERTFTSRVGVMAAVLGLSVATLNQSYVLWRDSNFRVLNEEVRRLGTSLAIYDEARRLIWSSAETGIKRMAQAYEDQMQNGGRRDGHGTAALHRQQPRARSL